MLHVWATHSINYVEARNMLLTDIPLKFQYIWVRKIYHGYHVIKYWNYTIHSGKLSVFLFIPK